MKVKSLSRVRFLATPWMGSLPGFSIHGIFQARVLEWGAIAFSKKLYREVWIDVLFLSCKKQRCVYSPWGDPRRVGHVWETAMTVLEFYWKLGWWIKGPATHSVTSKRVQKIRKRAWRQRGRNIFFSEKKKNKKKQKKQQKKPTATNRKWAKKCQQLPHVP